MPYIEINPKLIIDLNESKTIKHLGGNFHDLQLGKSETQHQKYDLQQKSLTHLSSVIQKFCSAKGIVKNKMTSTRENICKAHA